VISATVIGLFDAASDELELSTTSDAVADMARAPKMERLPKGVTHVMRQFLWFRVRRQPPNGIGRNTSGRSISG